MVKQETHYGRKNVPIPPLRLHTLGKSFPPPVVSLPHGLPPAPAPRRKLAPDLVRQYEEHPWNRHRGMHFPTLLPVFAAQTHRGRLEQVLPSSARRKRQQIIHRRRMKTSRNIFPRAPDTWVTMKEGDISLAMVGPAAQPAVHGLLLEKGSEPTMQGTKDEVPLEVLVTRPSDAVERESLDIMQAERIDTLLKRLKDMNKAIRYNAVKALGQLKVVDSVVEMALRQRLRDRDGMVRFQAGKSLAALGFVDDEVATTMIDQLDHEKGAYVIEVCNALSAHFLHLKHDGRLLQVLYRHFLEGEDHVKFAVSKLLVKMQDMHQVMHIVPLLIAWSDPKQGRTTFERAEAARHLGMIHHGSYAVQVEHLLVDLVTDKSWRVRKEAALGLGTLGHTSDAVADALVEQMWSDWSQDVRVATSHVLSQLNLGHRALRSLFERLNHKRPRIRTEACTALGALGVRSEPVIEMLMERFEDVYAVVRAEALRAARILRLPSRSQRVLDAVLVCTSDDSPHVRACAASAAATMGHSERRVVEMLMRLTEDPVDIVRSEAVRVLVQLATVGKDVKETSAPLRMRPGQRSKTSVQLDQRIISHVVRMMQDPSALVREQVVKALSTVGVDADLYRGDVAARKMAMRKRWRRIRSLTGRRCPLGGEADGLVQQSIHKEWGLRAEACTGLGQLRSADEVTLGALSDRLADAIGYVRAQACRALGSVLERAMEEVPVQIVRPLVYAIVLRLKDNDWSVRTEAARALGIALVAHQRAEKAAIARKAAQTAKEQVEVIIYPPGSPPSESMRTRMIALRRGASINPLRSPRANAAVVSKKKEDDPARIAAEAVVDADVVVRALLPLMTCSDAAVAVAAIRSLGAGTVALPSCSESVLEKALEIMGEQDVLKIPVANVRVGIIWLLASIGVNSESTTRALIHAVTDPSPRVRYEALRVLCAFVLHARRTSHAEEAIELDEEAIEFGEDQEEQCQIRVGVLGPATVARLLHVSMGALQDKWDGVRLEAARLMGVLLPVAGMGSLARSALHAVHMHCEDPTPAVRLELALASLSCASLFASTGNEVDSNASLVDFVSRSIWSAMESTHWRTRLRGVQGAGRIRLLYGRRSSENDLSHTSSLLRARLDDHHSDVRMHAAAALRRLDNGIEQAVDYLIDVLRVSAAAAEIQATMERQESQTDQLIMKAQVSEADCKQAHPAIRIAACANLAALGRCSNKELNERVLHALVQRLSDTDESVGKAAGRALVGLGLEQKTQELLADRIKTTEEAKVDQHQLVLHSMLTGEAGGQEQASALLQLGMLPPPSDLTMILPVISMLSSAHWRARTQAAKTLIAWRPEVCSDVRVCSVLLSRLDSREWRTRVEAAGNLGKMYVSSQNTSIATALLAHVPRNQEENAVVRSAAIRALTQLRLVLPGLIAALIQGLGDEDTFLRVESARALGSLGVMAPNAERGSAAVALHAALRDSVARARAASIRAYCSLVAGMAGSGVRRKWKRVGALLGSGTDHPALVHGTSAESARSAMGAAKAVHAHYQQTLASSSSFVRGGSSSLSPRSKLKSSPGKPEPKKPRRAAASKSALSSHDSEEDGSAVSSGMSDVLGGGTVAARRYAANVLIDRLQSDVDARVRLEAARGVACLRPHATSKIAQALLFRADDGNSNMRLAIVRALEAIWPPLRSSDIRQSDVRAVVVVLLRRMKDNNHIVRMHSCRAVAAVIRPTSNKSVMEVGSLSQLVAMESDKIQKKWPAVIAALEQSLMDWNPFVLREAASALTAVGRITQPRVISSVRQRMSDPDPYVRVQAIAAARAIITARGGAMDVATTTALIGCMQDSHPEVRLVAARAQHRQGLRGEGRELEATLRALGDPEEDVRAEAVATLSTLPLLNGRVTRTLLRAMCDPSHKVRLATRTTLLTMHVADVLVEVSGRGSTIHVNEW